jgi:AraC-like DNA-binding protein
MLHFSQRQQSPRKRGDLFLAGPGLPHFSARSRYPLEWISVYFLPSELLELDRGHDGGQILRRIAVVDPAGDRYIRPLPALRRQLLRGFGELADEFQRPAFGTRLKLRALLSTLLVDIVRGEQAKGWTSGKNPRAGNWVLAEKALNYLREHFAEPIYTRDLVAITGLSESGLRNVFHECVGMPWVQYLQAYRIHRAAALLLEPGASVTEAALAVGFENLGHFTTAFHACMKVAPRDYAKHRPNPADRKKRADDRE